MLSWFGLVTGLAVPTEPVRFFRLKGNQSVGTVSRKTSTTHKGIKKIYADRTLRAAARRTEVPDSPAKTPLTMIMRIMPARGGGGQFKTKHNSDNKKVTMKNRTRVLNIRSTSSMRRCRGGSSHCCVWSRGCSSHCCVRHVCTRTIVSAASLKQKSQVFCEGGGIAVIG